MTNDLLIDSGLDVSLWSCYNLILLELSAESPSGNTDSLRTGQSLFISNGSEEAVKWSIIFKLTYFA